jgi:hypothetical protein
MNSRQVYLIQEEVKRHKDNLGSNPRREIRCITAVAKQILLEVPYFYNGQMINPIAKSLGAGVWLIKHENNP